MECQTCSDQFTTSEALHEHIGFYQSQAQYHVRELLRCLAHVHSPPNSHVSGDDKPGNRLGDTGASFDFDSENTPCYELCPSCGRIMERASTYLHHNCKKGKSTIQILQRRKALRRQVDIQLREARTESSRAAHTKDPIEEDTHQRHKRRKTENGGIGTELPTTSAFSKPAHEVKDILGPSMATTDNVDDQPVSSNTETFSKPLNLLPMGSSLDLSLNLGEPSLPQSQFYHALPTSDPSHVAVAEYGAHGLDPFADMISMSKAPLMYAGTTLVSKAPLMYMSTQMFGLHDVEHELNGQAMSGAEHGVTNSVGSNMVTSTERTGDGYGPLGY
ncbi:hypothetical protein BDP55DRAFT_638468 [Colletotrichum godetiae]|uniref:Uncharacterized protein n=1 Tax=Colletotrichum godetiae TaxID=1209918 RepID=A0AAJ0A758_9PEZI|nr:uncharacterized protein BDP55DRAFT_638468 [Colletotrichum godetiae]KAK1657747.1 hypothetical protein BDP55DRAFT_638468 [Colletotrichum godetiae]